MTPFNPMIKILILFTACHVIPLIPEFSGTTEEKNVRKFMIFLVLVTYILVSILTFVTRKITSII